MTEIILTESQFKDQAFKYWIKTGVMYNNYKHYLNFAKKELQKKLLQLQLLKKELKNEKDKSKEKNKPKEESKPKKYIWVTEGDDKVRSSHSALEGEVREWTEEKLKPGEDFGCRCVAVFVDEYGYPTGEVGKMEYDENSKKIEFILNLITSIYGEVREDGKIHNGIDFAMPEGSLVRATVGGRVDRSRPQLDKEGNMVGYGNYVRIEDKDGMFYEYGHLLEQSHLEFGDIVEQGDLIGLVGSTGTSTGSHLHYTERIDDSSPNGKAVEPKASSVEFLLDDFARQRFDD